MLDVVALGMCRFIVNSLELPARSCFRPTGFLCYCANDIVAFRQA